MLKRRLLEVQGGVELTIDLAVKGPARAQGDNRALGIAARFSQEKVHELDFSGARLPVGHGRHEVFGSQPAPVPGRLQDDVAA